MRPSSTRVRSHISEHGKYQHFNGAFSPPQQSQVDFRHQEEEGR